MMCLNDPIDDKEPEMLDPKLWLALEPSQFGREIASSIWPKLPPDALEDGAIIRARIGKEASASSEPFAPNEIGHWIREHLAKRVGWTNCVHVVVRKASKRGWRKGICLRERPGSGHQPHVARLSLRAVVKNNEMEARCLFGLDRREGLKRLCDWTADPLKHLRDVLALLQVSAGDPTVIRAWAEVRRDLTGGGRVLLGELAWHCNLLAQDFELVMSRLPDIIRTGSWRALAEHGRTIAEALHTNRPDSQSRAVIAECANKLPHRPSQDDARNFIAIIAPLGASHLVSHELVLRCLALSHGAHLSEENQVDLRKLLLAASNADLGFSSFIRYACNMALTCDRLPDMDTVLAMLTHEGRMNAVHYLGAELSSTYLPPDSTAVWQDSAQCGRLLHLVDAWSALAGGQTADIWKRITKILPLDVDGRPMAPSTLWRVARELTLSKKLQLSVLLQELGLWAWQRMESDNANPDAPVVKAQAAMDTWERVRNADAIVPETVQALLWTIAQDLFRKKLFPGGSQRLALTSMMRLIIHPPEVEDRIGLAQRMSAFAGFWKLASAPVWFSAVISRPSSEWREMAVFLLFELDQCPWATPWSPFLAQTDFAKPQWFHLNMRLSRLPIDEFRKAVSWLSHLKCLDTARKEAVASAGRWLDIATYAHVQVASAALMLCDNADAARAMVSPHCLGKMLRDCLGAANRDQWSRIEQEATRTTPGCGEPLVQCLLETLVLDLMMDWQKLPPNSDVARNLWEWDVNLASHAAIADIFAKEAAKGDLANFNRWRECWAAADNGRREAMERLAARHVWERHKKEPIVETKLLETLWCTGILKEQPIWALDWWKEHCMKLLTAEPVSAKALVDLVKNTGTDLRQSLLNQLRFCHPEGTLKLQSGLERFGTHCLDEEQRKRWEILDKSLAKHHLRGPIMEDVLLGLK